MTIISEGRGAGEFIREPVSPISFDMITMRIGEVLVPGQVVGKVAGGGQANQYGALEEASTNGLQTPAGICFDHVDTSDAAADATIVARYCEVVGNRLTWPASYSAGDITAGIATLATLGIIVRIL